MNKFKLLLSTSNEPGSWGSKFRSKRFLFFEQVFWSAFKNKGHIHILDVGGTEEYWKDKSLLHANNISITLLNLTASPVSLPQIKSVAGNATDLSQFDDRSFDLV